MGLRALVVLIGVTQAACVGSFSQVERVETPAPPDVAEERVGFSFQAMGIPLLESSPNGWVRSGVFDPYHAFGARWADRVTCDLRPDDASRPGLRPTSLEVNAAIRSNRESDTRVEVESYGRGTTAEGEEVACRLSSSAVTELLASIPRPDPRFGGS